MDWRKFEDDAVIDFGISPAFQETLDWVRDFVLEHVEPMDVAFDDDSTLPYDRHHAPSRAILTPLQQIVKNKGLWGIHLPARLGGPGLTTVELCLINAILGRTSWGPVTFGAQAPDSGNGEILAEFGSAEQKERWLKPLWNGNCYSCFAMTEVEGGADPTQLSCAAVLDGETWVIDGEKWFSSHAHLADFLIVMVQTDPDAPNPHERFSTIIVPKETPGFTVVQTVGLAHEAYGTGGHPHIRFDGVRVPQDALLGPRGGGFRVAQARLGGGRIHHAMRTVGMVEKTIEIMTERAASRFTAGKLLGSFQLVQMDVAACWMELEQLKLLVLKASWLIDRGHEREARMWIAMCKVRAAETVRTVTHKAMHLLGSLGLSNLTPLRYQWIAAEVLGMADGPSEVHQMQLGRAILKESPQSPGRFPSYFLPTLKAAAKAKLEGIALESSAT